MSQNNAIQPINHLAPDTKKWFAVYVKVKTEKYVFNALQKQGITAYVPLVKEIKRYTNKVRKVEKPLLSCYVFVKIDRSEYIRVLQTQYVLGFLKINKSLISIPDKEIDMLKWVVGEELVKSIELGKIKQGTEVEVIAGNLTGLKGKIVNKSRKKSFLVALETMGYVMQIDIAEELLLPLH